MMCIPLSAENRRVLLASTRESASALLEDTDHIREVLARVTPTRGELRRLSAIARRLLIERDLTQIAAPRIGKFNFRAPDNNPVVKGVRTNPILFFNSGGAEVFGNNSRCWIISRGSKEALFDDFDKDKIIELRLDGFLKQPVLHLEGSWASRADVIKHVANQASGVHTSESKTPADILLTRIRRSLTFSVGPDGVGGHLKFDIFAGTKSTDSGTFAYAPDEVDFVLIELLSALHFMITSDDMLKLEQIIKAELIG